MNLTLNARECWGQRARIGPLAKYFSKQFEGHKVELTWRNSKRGRNKIAKGPNQFLVSKRVWEEAGRYKTWVGLGGSFDHMPILFQFEETYQKSPSPFKFNHAWI